MAESDFRGAAEPLFESNDVEVLEWTLDNGWAAAARGESLPAWCAARLDEFAAADALYGHGFSFSLMSGRFTARHAAWLKLLRAEMKRRTYRHVSEHFCFSLADGFSFSAPLPVPLTDKTLRLGQSRMRQLAEAAGRPVGLENIATALSRRDAVEQGQFIAELLEPVDGFVLLDVHNLYCQLHNFGMDARDALLSYPLERVRELHISGGSWDRPESDPDGRRFRRDTHDEAVPQQVFELLSLALSMCPGVEAVFFERIGNSMTPNDYPQFRADYQRVKELVGA